MGLRKRLAHFGPPEPFPPTKKSRPVSRVLSRVIIPLGPTSPWASSGLPGSARGSALPLVHCQKSPRGAFDGREPKGVTFVPCSVLLHTLLERLPYLALLQVGFTVPALLPRTRCALTAPFHPYRPPWLTPRQLRRSALCCTFRGLTPPRRYLAPDPLEPGLSSTPVLPPRQRSPGQLFGAHDTSSRGEVNLEAAACRILLGVEASRLVGVRACVGRATGCKRIGLVTGRACQLRGDRGGSAWRQLLGEEVDGAT